MLPSRRVVQQMIPPEPPQESLPEGELTLCELNADLLTMKGEDDSASLALYISAEGVKYPNIVVKLAQRQPERDRRPILRQRAGAGASSSSSGSRSSSGGGDTFFSRLWHGFGHVGMVLSSSLKRKRWDLMGGDDMLDVRSAKRNQTPERPIRAFAWHRYRQVFAVAKSDDSISIYDLITQQWSPVCLRHELQKNITTIEWQPLAGAVLAVGCEAGVVIWRVPLLTGRDITGVSSLYALPTEKHTATLSLLQRSGHGPVSSISWSPDGQFLASASPEDSSVLIWDRVLGVSTPLKRLGGPGIHLIKWSPNGHYLFAATTSSLFLIFETKTWFYQKWNFSRPCQAAAWSTDGRYLLVSEAGESIIHTIRLRKEPPLVDAEYVRCEAVGPYQVEYPMAGERKVGGPIRTMEWDQNGERLVVTFSGDEEGRELIALYVTRLHPFLQFSPRGFIRGPKEGKKADIVAFANHFPRGSLLAACWLNGKISFYPLYYQPTNSVELHKW